MSLIQLQRQIDLSNSLLQRLNLTRREKPRSLIDTMKGIPGWRAVFGGGVGGAGEWISEHGVSLARSGGATYRIDATSGAGYWDYDGSGDYHSAADAALWDALGNEAWIQAADQGVTVAALVQIDSYGTAGQYRGIIIKSDGTASGYNFGLVTFQSTSVVYFEIFNGVTPYNAPVPTSTGSLHMVIGRFDPSSYIETRVDSVAIRNTTSIPASANNSAGSIYVGRLPGNVDFDGRVYAWALWGRLISDDDVEELCRIARVEYGAGA